MSSLSYKFDINVNINSSINIYIVSVFTSHSCFFKSSLKMNTTALVVVVLLMCTTIVLTIGNLLLRRAVRKLEAEKDFLFKEVEDYQLHLNYSVCLVALGQSIILMLDTTNLFVCVQIRMHI